jgi:hypothetical protein
VAVLTLLLASFGGISSALAQGGSIGGSVGPSEKTLSGDRNAAAPAAPATRRPNRRRTETEPGARMTSPKEPAASSRCQMVLGSWAFSNGVGVVFKAGGAMSSTKGDDGTWSCSNGMVQAHWAHWTDHYLVSPDGAHITGNSGLLNMALTATKN